MQCKAHIKSRARRCNANAVKGREVCRMHGGKTPVGIALPQFKDGRYSKYMPAPLAAKCREMLADPEWMSLNAEIATARGRIAELMANLPADGPGESMKRLAVLKAAFITAKAKDDLAGANAALTSMFATIDAINAGIDAWADIDRSTDLLRRLIETQAKVSLAAGYLWEVAEVMRSFQALMQAIRENVPDQQARAAIQARAAELGFMK